MSGHLCLKWNNHSSAFLKSISTIQDKKRYCDATIACQGKYFPVHRIVLSTCSDYFEEMFERIQCQHPYIVFKDIEPREMELLLNYMYQGEVNVVQEMLPTLIKAAEALRIKGLAVPDDAPSGKKRSSSNTDTPLPKKSSEDVKRRRQNSSGSDLQVGSSSQSNLTGNFLGNHQSGSFSERIDSTNSVEQNEPKVKEEPLDSCEYDDSACHTAHDSISSNTQSKPINQEENVYANFPITNDDSSYIKTENDNTDEQPYDTEASSWNEFDTGSTLSNLPPIEMENQDNIHEGDWRVSFENIDTPGDFAETSVTSQNFKISQDRSYHLCPYCTYKSYTKAYVKSHIMFKHTGERPFPCSVCRKRFTRKTDLQRHMLSHTGEKKYHCSKCSAKFSFKTNLKRHARHFHEFSPPTI